MPRASGHTIELSSGFRRSRCSRTHYIGSGMPMNTSTLEIAGNKNVLHTVQWTNGMTNFLKNANKSNVLLASSYHWPLKRKNRIKCIATAEKGKGKNATRIPEIVKSSRDIKCSKKANKK